jgi:diguanylate cyclase (GGDEF)-like protein
VQLTGSVEANAKAAELPEAEPPARQPTTVLVAEDHEDQRALCEMVLQKAGYRVIAVNNGRKAIEKLHEEAIDIALLDIMMPEMSGLEVCRSIREESEQRSIYVIFLTALARGEDRVKGLESGADDYITKPFYHRELLARVSVGERLIAQRRELERLAALDPLTELYNRRMFEEKFAAEFERAKRYRRALSFLILDLDNFKQVNDEYGHQQGDAVIKTLARIMREKTRRSDTLARYGGEEFALILPEVDAAGAGIVAEKIRREIKKVTFEAKPGERFSVTISIGLTSFEHGSYGESSEMFRDADQALYKAKASGKDCVVASASSGPARP